MRYLASSPLAGSVSRGSGKLGDWLGQVSREWIWVPVRHEAEHHIAAYYVETSGTVVEFYADLEQISADNWNR